MRIRHGEFERIRMVLAEADPDEPLTAREIVDLLEAHGEQVESAHRVATVLGRRARDGSGDVEVIDGHPYRYRFDDGSS